MLYQIPGQPSAIIPLFGIVMAILANGSDSAMADEITDFNGYDVEMSVNVTADGGQSFFANLFGSDTATIGAGNEFSINVGATGFSTKAIRIDFDNSGLVNAYADAQFGLGNTSFSDFSFDVSFSLVNAEITSAISSGDLVRGDATTSGVDPVVWTFVNETDNSFGNIMTFGPVNGTTPKVQLSANSVPEPSTVVLVGLISTVLFCRRRLRFG